MLRLLLAATLAGSVAVAAPVPKAPPGPDPKASANFTLGTGVIADNPRTGVKALRFTYEMPGLVASDPLIGGVGRPPRPLTTSLQLTAIKVTTADGKELTGEDLEKKLAEAVPMVRSTVAFDAEWKKLFADDVLFLESVRPAVGGGGVINPLPGGGVVRPLPGLIRPLPALPVDPPVEK